VSVIRKLVALSSFNIEIPLCAINIPEYVTDVNFVSRRMKVILRDIREVGELNTLNVLLMHETVNKLTH
jgi:hypothetical protein